MYDIQVGLRLPLSLAVALMRYADEHSPDVYGPSIAGRVQFAMQDLIGKSGIPIGGTEEELLGYMTARRMKLGSLKRRESELPTALPQRFQP